MVETKRFSLVLSILLAIFLGFSLAGCSKGYDVEFGSDSDSASKINITNDTGSSISALEVTTDETVTEISNNIISDSSTWDSGNTAKIGYAGSDSLTILFKTSESTYVMHNLDLQNVEKATLKIDGEYAYLEYEKDGNTVNTLEDEKAYVKAQQEKKEAEEKAKAEAQQKAKEEAEAKAKAEEEAKAQAEAAAAAAQAQSSSSQNSSSSSGSSSSGSSSRSSGSSGSSSSGSGSVTQSEDGCLDSSKF